MIFYHYIYQAFIRLQIALGGKKREYMEWKASLFMVIMTLWWILILAILIEVLSKHTWLFSYPFFTIPAIAAFAVYFERICLSSRDANRRYEELFAAWPCMKRKMWDAGVVIFSTTTALLFFLFLYKVRKI